jgi:hypothetical protein
MITAAQRIVLLAVTAGALAGCTTGTVGVSPTPRDPRDAGACGETRMVVMAAEHRLEDIVRTPTEASQRYLDYAGQVRASTAAGSAPLVAAGERLATAYERLSASAVTGSGPDLGVLRTAVAAFVDVCGSGSPTATESAAR